MALSLVHRSRLLTLPCADAVTRCLSTRQTEFMPWKKKEFYLRRDRQQPFFRRGTLATR